MRSLGQRYEDGDLTLDQLNALAQSLIIAGHIAAATYGVESEVEVTEDDVEPTTAEQVERLERLRGEIAAGAIGVAAIAPRLASYGRSAKQAYYQAGAVYRVDLGYELWESVLRVAEHCDECIDEAARDPRPLDEIVPIGYRTCNVGCQCYLRATTADGDVYVL